MSKPPAKPLDQLGNRPHLLPMGMVLFLAGLIIGLIATLRLAISIPSDQALLNQGMIMCGDTLMSPHDTCTVRECQSQDDHGFCLRDKIVAANDREQQKRWNQQHITSEQHMLPALLCFCSLTCSTGIALLFWSLREYEKRAERDIHFTSLSGQIRGTCSLCHTLDRPLHRLSKHEYSCPSCLRKLKQNQSR